MKREILIVVALAVIAVSLYTILKPSIIPESRVNSKVSPQVVELPKSGAEIEIEGKYKNRTFNVDPESDKGKRLLLSAHQVLLNLQKLRTFKEEIEMATIKEKSSYIEIKFKTSHDLAFGQIIEPSVRLVFIVGGDEEYVGFVASQPSKGAVWSCYKIQQDSPYFLRLVDLVPLHSRG